MLSLAVHTHKITQCKYGEKDKNWKVLFECLSKGGCSNLSDGKLLFTGPNFTIRSCRNRWKSVLSSGMGLC